MISAPRIEQRGERPYMGIRTEATMRQLSRVIPELLDELFAWLAAQNVEAAGAPFIRYHVIDMAAKLEIELGVPVVAALPGNGRIAPNVIPAGRYAMLTYVGTKRAIDANRELLQWGAAQELMWDRFESEKGDHFGGRFETFLTDPDEEPNQAKWETEVAIRLSDDAQQP